MTLYEFRETGIRHSAITIYKLVDLMKGGDKGGDKQRLVFKRPRRRPPQQHKRSRHLYIGAEIWRRIKDGQVPKSAVADVCADHGIKEKLAYKLLAEYERYPRREITEE